MNPVNRWFVDHYRCSYIDPSSQVVAWEDPEDAENGLPPNLYGCTRCGEMVRAY